MAGRETVVVVPGESVWSPVQKHVRCPEDHTLSSIRLLFLAFSSYLAASLLLPSVLVTISTYYIVSEAAAECAVRTKWSPPTVRTWYCSRALSTCIHMDAAGDGRVQDAPAPWPMPDLSRSSRKHQFHLKRLWQTIPCTAASRP